MESLRERLHREAAEARAGLVDELDRRTVELQQAREELRRATETKDQFLAILSHELRTPLTPILAVVSHRAAQKDLPEDVLRDLEMIRRNVELEARLIDDLVDFSRITEGTLTIDRGEVEFARIVRHVVEMCRDSGQPQAHVSFTDSADRTRVNGDAGRLTQVVWNLLRNALKFTPPSGEVNLRLFNDGDRILLEVADTGQGIDEVRLPQIFGALENGGRLKSSQFGGLGLGLAISRAILDLHEGKITAASRGRDCGATFRVELPTLQGAQEGGSKTSRLDPGLSAGGERAHVRILLVDDHADTCAIMGQILTAMGHEVTLAYSLAQAVAVASDRSLDLLISDLSLTDGSGLDVLREVSRIQPVKAIAVSGYSMEKDVAASRQAGFLAHLTKPIDVQALGELIARVFSSVSPGSSQTPSRPESSEGILSVLLVEDHLDTAIAVEEALRHRNCRVRRAASVAEGLQAIIEQSFDVIVSDVGLPDGHGVSLIHGVRRFCQTPAIALTAFSSADDVARCMKAGFDLHLPKPIEMGVLYREIVRLADLGKSGGSNRLGGLGGQGPTESMARVKPE